MSALGAALLAELDDALESDPALAASLAAKLKPYLPDPAGEEPGGFLAPQAAADYLGVTRKRVHDLTSMRAIVPDGHDGRTPLYRRSTLDAYARST